MGVSGGTPAAASCAELDLGRYAALRACPIVPCDLCGSQPQLKRAEVKRLLAELERSNPLLRKNLTRIEREG